jgi:adenylate cyclase
MNVTTLTLFAADLARYSRATAGLGPLEVAAFLDDWYRHIVRVVRAHGGRIVKFMGDGCLATFGADACAAAIDAAIALGPAVDDLRARHRLDVELGVNIHLAEVAEGEVGPDDDRRYDVLGSALNDLFRMGGGAGIRISEPVHRNVPAMQARFAPSAGAFKLV